MAGVTSFFSAFPRPLKRSELGLFLAILVVVLLTSLLDDRHLYWNELKALLLDRDLPWFERIPSAINILRQTAFLGIFALGAAIVIISGGIDLSSGSMIAFSGSICATIMVLLAPDEMKYARPVGLTTIALAIAGTLCIAFLIGSFHAWLITVIGLPPFIATLATLVGLRSFARAIVENVTAIVWGGKSSQINMFDNQFRFLATSVWIPVLLFILLAGAGWLLLSRTVVGRHLYALGGNEQAARLSGIRTDRLKWLSYCISAILSAVAGILYIGDQSAAHPQTLGQGYELNAIAAAVVGGCSLQGGVGTIPGTVLGVLFLRTVIDGVAKIIKTGADVYEGLIVGAVVVVAVALTRLRQAGRTGKRFLSGTLGFVTAINLSLLGSAFGILLGLNFEVSAQFTDVEGLHKLKLASWIGARCLRIGTVEELGQRKREVEITGSCAIGLTIALAMLVMLFLFRYLEGRREKSRTQST